MKLTAAELTRVAELAERHGSNCPRAIPGQPGSRALPLSYRALLAERERQLHRSHG
jgi:hypothetical protein